MNREQIINQYISVYEGHAMEKEELEIMLNGFADDIVNNLQPSLPDNLDEVAWQYAEQEVKTWGSTEPNDKKEVHDDFIAGAEWDREQMMKASRNVYESWMGGTMDDVRRDMVELGKVLNVRKEESK